VENNNTRNIVIEENNTSKFEEDRTSAMGHVRSNTEGGASSYQNMVKKTSNVRMSVTG